MKHPSEHFEFLSRAVLPVAALGLAVMLPSVAQAQAAGSDADADRGTATSSASSTMDAGKLDEDSKEFIHEAAKSGLMEVRLSQLALERTNDSKVRVCAQAILNDHQRANAELASLANRRGIMLPLDTAAASQRMSGESSTSGSEATRGTGATADSRSSTSSSTYGSSSTAKADSAQAEKHEEMTADVQKAVDRLSRESGEEFDRAYIDEMVKGHEKAIELFEEQAENTSNPELAQYAQSTLPTLREHLSRAQALQRSLKG